MPLATLDDAFPPTVEVASAYVRKVNVEVHSAPAVTWIAFDVGGRAGTSETTVPIDLPAGTRIVAMTAAHDGRPPELATARNWHRALQEVQDGADPTVVSWEGESGGAEHVQVRTRGGAAIAIAVELPPISRLRVVAASALVAASVDGVAAAGDGRMLDLSAVRAADAADAAAMPAVDRLTSLLSDDGVARGVIVDFAMPVATWHEGLSSKDIRRRFRLYQPRLRQCYMAVAQRDPRVHGTALMRLMIAADGSVEHAFAASALPAEVTECLTAEVASWNFGENGDRTQVNYPLIFQLVR